MVLLLISLSIAFVTYLVLVKPIFWLLFYKMKMGNQAKIYFYPLKGFPFFLNRSFE